MRVKQFFLWAFLFSVIIPFSAYIFADGFIIPQPRPGEIIPPLTVKYHRVEVEIKNQVARTSIDQVFINNHHKDIEGIFIFPLPEKVAISEFSMYIGEKQVKGEILDRDEARRLYEEIVRKLKDPALLEYMGRNLFRARVYPIPANGEKRIKLSYTEILKAEGEIIRFVYPLNTERFSLRPIEEVTISVRIKSQVPLANIYSPSHKVSVRKTGDKEATVSYEETNVKPEKDFILYYSLASDDVGLSFMNWKGPEENYYMLFASPRYVSPKEKIIKKNLCFVLDSSGSMSGKKINQAKEAVRFVIRNLNKDDRFSIIDFDDSVNVFTHKMLPADAETKKEAIKFVDDIDASGGTNIHDALLRALEIVKIESLPNYILFLTDGLPTVGVTDTASILNDIRKANMNKSRVFVFGVGNDVNTELLDRISLENRGTSVYVGENENLEVAISSYYEKISTPVLSDLHIDFEGIKIRDSYPRILPDLFKGSQMILIGKYTGEGPVKVTLIGKVGEKKRTFTLVQKELVRDESFNFIPRLWATRRVGYLLEEIRLHGEKKELVDEVKALGLKYGIITPYTSFLVTEKERKSMDIVSPEAADAFRAKKITGEGAVKIARATQMLKGETQPMLVISQNIQYKYDKTFYLKDGLWVDSVYDEELPLKEIRFNSDEYFELLSKKPDLARYLSVGKNIIVSHRGISYKIIE